MRKKEQSNLNPPTIKELRKRDCKKILHLSLFFYRSFKTLIKLITSSTDSQQ